MKITIEDVTQAPKWTTIQSIVRGALNNDDGRLTRICRNDGACSYRDKGIYSLTFTPYHGDETLITLEIK